MTRVYKSAIFVYINADSEGNRKMETTIKTESSHEYIDGRITEFCPMCREVMEWDSPKDDNTMLLETQLSDGTTEWMCWECHYGHTAVPDCCEIAMLHPDQDPRNMDDDSGYEKNNATVINNSNRQAIASFISLQLVGRNIGYELIWSGKVDAVVRAVENEFHISQTAATQITYKVMKQMAKN